MTFTHQRFSENYASGFAQVLIVDLGYLTQSVERFLGQTDLDGLQLEAHGYAARSAGTGCAWKNVASFSI